MLNKRNLLPIDKVVQCQGNILSEMDGNKVMLSISNGKYYNFGETGSVIWDLMQNPNLIDNIISILVKDYEVDKETCQDQVISFLEKLSEEKLIKLLS